jgi:hypothetical protein
MTVSGIDVASYQNNSYATAGLGFVMVKATEGTGYVNPRHAAQIATGRQHSLIVGHYHFVKPGDMRGQADFFLRNAAPKAGDVLALDWEDPGVTGAQKDAWIKYVQGAEPTHRVLLYCNRDFWLNRDSTSFAGDGLWIADPEAAVGHPRVKTTPVIHQYGIRGGTDLDVALFGSAAEMAAWAHFSKPPVNPPAPHTPPPLHLVPKVSLRVVKWAALNGIAEERKYPQNEDQVWTVQNALVANGCLKKGHFIPGIYDTPTKLGYKAEQEAQGYRGNDADGVPGPKSLGHLGKQHHFTAVA